MILPEHKAVFIHINRTGGTSIERYFGKPEMDHSTPLEVIELIGWAKWSECFKFTIVRNPWDRMYSVYKWRVKTEATTLSFSDWLRSLGDDWWMCQFNWISDQRRNIMVDFVGRYETLDKDFKHICNKIGIKSESLPHTNRTTNTDFRDHYSAEDREYVAQMCSRDIKEFGYTFFKVL